MIAVAGDNRMLGFGLLKSSCPGIFHFVTTRSDGCSTGNYASLNCTHYTGDEQANVLRNRELLCGMMPACPQELLIPRQVHGIGIRVVDASYSALSEVGKSAVLDGVDALVTDVPGYCLCVSTADCVPVLLCDIRQQVVAVAHAGWRGTVRQIVRKTLQTMEEVYHTHPEDVVAGIAPSISASSFEVGDEVWQAFSDEGFDMACISFRDRDTGKWHIDLWEANRLQLLEEGVKASCIEVAGICTYMNVEQFFSARRLGLQSGRMLSGIMRLPEK